MKPLRPYLYHAYYQWIIDNDNTPYLLVNADYPDVDVPQEYIRDGKIILNISPRSIGQYVVNDDYISFEARFNGMLRQIYIPFGAAEAIYAQESGDGVMFQDESYYQEAASRSVATSIKEPKKRSGRLKLVK
ncbi:peptidase [[Actinobacillus] muris]|uniref:Peptidase n=1 Tax=Muribacter muris TaxID=67855 RepID=A0A0J5P7T2_9PAST|nr:ClpXP protease specificity-enhancing factor [Muribacter muris]KMK51820.1 peptidase [[Actinobacillus] muris] [Muribacter muris]